jgi:hypothetical protein
MSARHAFDIRHLPHLRALIAGVVISAAPAVASPLGLTVRPIGTPTVEAAQAVEPTVAPTSPASFAAQSVQPDTAVALWRDTSNNETGFKLEGRTADNPTFSQIGDTLPANTTSVGIDGLSPGVTYVFRVRATNASGDSAPSNTVVFDALTSVDCVASPTIICLNNSEFRVQALYLTASGLSGEAHAVKLVSDSGYLWFFAESNIELVVKVLNGCTSNSHYWVFAGGLTDVRVLLTVTDTVGELSRSYGSPLGTAYQPLQDTSAFATCATP